eukprot:COSAG01_NODE_3161_length_6481_cov_89.230962_7_plen_70_part_00
MRLRGHIGKIWSSGGKWKQTPPKKAQIGHFPRIEVKRPLSVALDHQIRLSKLTISLTIGSGPQNQQYSG